MKKITIYPLWPWFLLVLLLVPSVLQAVETESASQPVAVMPETVFEFPDTLEGDSVIHDFVLQNKGRSVLNIQVKTT